MRGAWLGILLFVFSGAAFALDQPDHDKWQAGINAARTAIANKDSSGIEDAIATVFEQAIRMSDRDPRMFESAALITQGLDTIDRLTSRARIDVVLSRMNELTKVPGGLANMLSYTPAIGLAQKRVRDRDFDGARDVLADWGKRATADFGPAHPSPQAARRQEGAVAMAAGDYEGALALLNEVRETTKRAFGPTSAEYAEASVSVARVQVERDNFEQARALADEALALFAKQPPPNFNPILTLASIFEDLGELNKAREIYELVDIARLRVPDEAEGMVPVLTHLSVLHARLGDGAAARSAMNRAMELGRSAVERSPSPYVEALLSEARLYSYIDRPDRAVTSLKLCEPFLESAGSERAQYLRRRLAGGYALARKFDRALMFADSALRAEMPGTATYASAASLVAYAAAQMDPPIARVALAQEAVDIRRKLDPKHEPYNELNTLALAYAAAGRWRESVDLQRRIIDEQVAKRGRYDVSWTDWRVYANSLQHVGRKKEAAEILTRVAAETAPLAAALTEGGGIPAGVVVSERSVFGFSVDLSDTAWKRSSSDSNAAILATFVAQFRPAAPATPGSLWVTPLLLPDGVDTDAAIDGLMRRLKDDHGPLTPWSKGSLRGYEYRFTRAATPGGRPWEYLCRLLVEGQRVYLVMAAVMNDDERALGAITAAMDAVTLTATPDSKTFSEADKAYHSRMLSIVGGELVDHGRFNDALALYNAAREAHATDALLEDIIYTSLRAGRFQVARDEVDRYPGGPAADPRLYLVRALSHQRLGNKKGALGDYKAGFAAGVRDDDYASQYVKLLLDQKLDTDAVAFLDAYAAVKSSPTVVSMQALVSFRVGDDERLDSAFEALEDPGRSSAEAALVGALLHKQRGGADELQQFVMRIPEKLKSAELYLLLASAQIEAKLPNEASKNVAAGLALAPGNEDLKRLDHLLKAKQGPVL